MATSKLLEYDIGWIWRRKALEDKIKERNKAKRIKDVLGHLEKMAKKRQKRANDAFAKFTKRVKKAVKKKRDDLKCLQNRMGHWPGVTTKAVIDKFGPSPTCYLTGLPIDYTKGDTYHLDHVIPRSKGGPSTLDNMRLVHPVVNMMKTDYPLEEFLHLCRLIAAKHPASL